MFVELTRYSPAVGLHAAVTLRLEFLSAGHAVAALSVRPFALQRLSAGLSMPLLTTVGSAFLAPPLAYPNPAHTLTSHSPAPPPMRSDSPIPDPALALSPQVSLLLFAVYFSVAEARAWRREGCVRTARSGAWARWLLVALTAAAALLRLAQLGAADRQWTHFVRRRPRRFTSFEQVAQLSAAARGLVASLLFLLLVKVRAGPAGLRLGSLGQAWLADASCLQAAQQLRFVRQWSVFGKTLCRALPELLGAALGLMALAVAYAQLAILVGDSAARGGGVVQGAPLTHATFPLAGIFLCGLTYEGNPGPLGAVPQGWVARPLP